MFLQLVICKGNACLILIYLSRYENPDEEDQELAKPLEQTSKIGEKQGEYVFLEATSLL
jgi:hypothetical protein